MNARIEFQTILGADGLPAFVVLPYAEFMRRFDPDRDLVPNAVVNLAMDQGWSPARAWREHLGLPSSTVWSFFSSDIGNGAQSNQRLSCNSLKIFVVARFWLLRTILHS